MFFASVYHRHCGISAFSIVAVLSAPHVPPDLLKELQGILHGAIFALSRLHE